MQVVCLDLEGVLIPEIWIAFAERTGIADFRRTTREEPDYDTLMRYRLALLKQHGLKLADIQAVIAGMAPMEGAKAFLDELRDLVIIKLCFQNLVHRFCLHVIRNFGCPSLVQIKV